MQDLLFIPISKYEFKEMIKDSLNEVLTEQTPRPITFGDNDKPLSIKEAGEFLNLARQTIYGLTSKNLIPFSKRGKKLYFNKSELIQWLSEGKNKSISEIEIEANNYTSNKII